MFKDIQLKEIKKLPKGLHGSWAVRNVSLEVRNAITEYAESKGVTIADVLSAVSKYLK